MDIQKLFHSAIDLVKTAEDNAATMTGPQKKAWVVQMIHRGLDAHVVNLPDCVDPIEDQAIAAVVDKVTEGAVSLWNRFWKK